MNKSYVIPPLVLCALFGVYYFQFAEEQQITEAAKKKEVAAKIAEEKRKKDETEAKARADADERRCCVL